MKGRLKQKHIQNFLQDIQDFKYGQKQKINLQQYMTPPNIASQLLYYIYQTQPLQNSIVADIGVGTGMLICGMIYLQSSFVIGIELDSDYIQITKQLLDDKVEGGNYDLILSDVKYTKVRSWDTVDLVVMNPPFGTKEEGLDMVFLEFAMKICRGNIYSMHKSCTRKFVNKFCIERGYMMKILFQVKFPLKKKYKGYHKKDIVFIDVDIILAQPSNELLMKRKKQVQNSFISITKQVQHIKQQQQQIVNQMNKIKIIQQK